MGVGDAIRQGSVDGSGWAAVGFCPARWRSSASVYELEQIRLGGLPSDPRLCSSLACFWPSQVGACLRSRARLVCGAVSWRDHGDAALRDWNEHAPGDRPLWVFPVVVTVHGGALRGLAVVSLPIARWLPDELNRPRAINAWTHHPHDRV